jgi:hypothetical protein
MSGPSPQRRASQRQKTKVFCGADDDPRLFGRSRDVSSSGAFVEWPNEVPLGAVVDVSFAWHDELLSCKARVVRYADDGLGLAFVNPSPGVRAQLERILEASETER